MRQKSSHIFNQAELSLPVSQILALLVKIVRKITKRLVDIQKEAISKSLEPEGAAAVVDADEGATEARKAQTNWKPLETNVEAELDEAGEEETEKLKSRERQREMIDSLDLKR